MLNVFNREHDDVSLRRINPSSSNGAQTLVIVLQVAYGTLFLM